MNDRSRGEPSPSPAVARKPAAPGRQPVRARARRPVAPDNLQVVQLARAGGSAPVAALPGTPLGNQEEQDRVTRARSAPGGCGDCAVAARHFGVQAKCAGCAEKARAAVQPACDTCESDAPNLDRARPALAGASQSLPHQDRIQASFGKHDLSAVRTVTGGAAKDANDDIGARAFTSGERIGFRESPDEWLAAHESAHVIQQREGASMPGDGGDAWERHADQVADTVVSGRSAEPLLDEVAGGDGVRTPALQLDDEKDKGKPKVLANETQDEFEKRVKDAGAARLTQNIAVLGKWRSYVASMKAFQLKAQLLTTTIMDYYTTAMGMFQGDKKFEQLMGTQEGGLRSYLSQKLKGDPTYAGGVQGFQDLIWGRSYGYYTTPSIATKAQMLVGDVKEENLPPPKWVAPMQEYEFYRETLDRVTTKQIHSGCQYCHEINLDWDRTAKKYGSPLPDPNRWNLKPNSIVPLASIAFDFPGMKKKKAPAPTISDADYSELVKWIQAQNAPKPPAAQPPPAAQQEPPAQQPGQQPGPPAQKQQNPFLPEGDIPAEVTVPPPRSTLCGKLPEKAAGTPSPNLSSWGPNSAIVANVIARVNAALTPLGPRGYRVLTGDTFDALWSMTPDSMEGVRAQILSQIDVRIGDYTSLRGQIQGGSVPYYELCPIVDELFMTTSDAVKMKAFKDVMEMRFAESVLNAIDLILVGLSFMFPPAAIVTVPAALALGLVRMGMGADQVRQGGQWSKGIGAGVYSAEQEAEAPGLATKGWINIAAGALSVFGSARHLAKMEAEAAGGATSTALTKTGPGSIAKTGEGALAPAAGEGALVPAAEEGVQPVINVIKTPNGYVITNSAFPGCAIKVEGAAVEAVNEAGEVVATGVVTPKGIVWKTGPFASGDVGAAMVPGEGAAAGEGANAAPKPGTPTVEGGAAPKMLPPGPKAPAPKAWDDPTLTEGEFIAGYRQRIPGKQGLSDDALKGYYAKNYRFNPATGRMSVPRVEAPPGFARAEPLPEPGTPAYDQWKKWKPGDANSVPCFPAGTPVLTPSGPKPIDELLPGDQVFAGDAGERAVVSTVTDVHRNWAAELVCVDTPRGETWATLNHPFRVVDKKDWLPAGRLEAGMVLRLWDGSTTRVRSVERAAAREATFNLSVATHHTYYVSQAGILVHNEPSVYESAVTKDFEIYRVVDLRTGKVVYVGQSIQGVDVRLADHVADEKSVLYIKDSAERANFAKIYKIETQAKGTWTQYEANVWEQHIMDVERGNGANLLNRQAGIDWKKGSKYVDLHNPCR